MPDDMQQSKKSLGDRLLRAGSIAGSVSAILILAGTIIFIADKYATGPYVQKQAAPLIEKVEAANSVKWKANDSIHGELRSLISQEFKVIMVYQKASMTEKALQKAGDELVNDSSISPVLKMQ
jgi:hypothetical protein